jgi:hypothetical protein
VPASEAWRSSSAGVASATVGKWDADEFADHLDRQWSGEVCQQIDAAALDVPRQVVEERGDDRGHSRSQVFGAAGSERGSHQPTQPQVLRAVHLTHGPQVTQAFLGDTGWS